mmetsp:Transcript_26340/g.35164  ORF Transcript_26340/g.35164 Transcript_26340/m.35164 type:complete len:213 (-) Transcript_26340:401-1039(-)
MSHFSSNLGSFCFGSFFFGSALGRIFLTLGKFCATVFVTFCATVFVMFCATPRVFLIAALASWAIVPIRPRRPNGFLAPPNRSPRKPPPCFSFFCLPPSPLRPLLPPSFGARVLPKTGPLRPSIPWLPQMPLPWLPPLPPFWPLPPCWFCWEGRKLCWLLARFYCCMLSSCRRFCSRSSLSSSRCLSRLSLSSSFCCYRRSFASWRLSCRSC